jgi:hypothetical protein
VKVQDLPSGSFGVEWSGSWDGRAGACLGPGSPACLPLNLLLLIRVTQAPPLPFPLVELKSLFEIAGDPERVVWSPFREGVEIHRLYGDGISGPTAALIRLWD